MLTTIFLRNRLIALITGVFLFFQPSLARSDQTDQRQLKEEEKITLVQVIRRIMGLSRRVAVGGSRSSDTSSICLVTPELIELKGQLQVRVNVPSPVIVTAEPLNELTLLNEDGRVIYRKLASSNEAIETPFTWPLAPLKGDERWILKLRPRGASGGDSARIPFLVASADTLKLNSYKLDRLENQKKLKGNSWAINDKIPTHLLSQLVFSEKDLSKKASKLKGEIKNKCLHLETSNIKK